MLPKIFQLEPTNFCTLSCFFCPWNEMKRKKGYMPFENFKKIIDRDAKNTDRLGLYMMGESLLHPDIINMINYCSYKNIKPELATNSTLLSGDIARELARSQLSYLILDVTKGKTNKYMFDRIIKNIKNFLQLSPLYEFCIQYISFSENTDWLYDEFKEYDKYIKIKFIDTWAGHFDKNFTKNNIPNHRIPCQAINESVSITWDGYVIPCCRVYDNGYVYGNIFNDTLDDIFNLKNPLYKKLYEENLTCNYTIEPCKSCREWFIIMDRKVNRIE